MHKNNSNGFPKSTSRGERLQLIRRVIRKVLDALTGNDRAKRDKERALMNYLFEHGTASERFEAIYEQNYWGNSESVSGVGSTLEYALNLRNELPALFKKFGIRTVFDGPCGDFNWISDVIHKAGINYIGGDIVEPLVEKLKSAEGDKVKFRLFDITQDKFPKADLWISRDCWPHFSYADIVRMLECFCSSDIPFVLTTSHLNEEQFKNKDIVTGDFRSIDLFSYPFNFPRETLDEIDDWIEPFPPRKMFLWSREQVKSALENFELENNQFPTKNSQNTKF